VQFTELLAMAVANAESPVGLARLAEEQAALGRVATLVARGVSPNEVFAAVTEEVGRVFPVQLARMGRYEPDDRRSRWRGSTRTSLRTRSFRASVRRVAEADASLAAVPLDSRVPGLVATAGAR
jgi:GAF domain-containing protein